MSSDFQRASQKRPESSTALTSTVVRYTDRPDRCTVYPPEASGDARLSTWLTVDSTVCVALESMR
jgi:hypothetical protein